MRPLPGRAAFATRTSASAASVARRSTAAGSARSHAIARAPSSAASGSSTSARRPVSKGALRPSPARGRSRARARPSRPVSRTVRPPRFTREDRHGRGEGVQEVLPADRADLAGGEEAGGGRAREDARDGVGVVVGRAEHAASAAVAGEHERAGRRAAPKRLHRGCQRLDEVAVGAVGVAGVQADDLARAHVRADRDGARRGVGARQPADEEVALQVVGLVDVDDDAHQQPARRPVRCPRARGPRSSRGASRARACPPAPDHVALGGGHRELRADGRRALRDARQDLDAVEAHADGALAEHLVAQEQRAAAVGGRAPTPGRPGAGPSGPSRQEAQDGVGREAVAGPRAGGRRAAPSRSGIPARAPPPSTGSTVA